MPVTSPGRLLLAADEPDPDRILGAIVEVTRAERGFLVLRDEGELRVVSSRDMDHEEVRRANEKVSRTFLSRALEEGRPLVASDAEMDGVQSLQAQKVRSVCAVPLRRCDGAIYLDHRYETGLFADLREIMAVADVLDRALYARGPVPSGGLVGRSPAMRELKRVLSRVADSPYPVLLHGETGSGKELAARAIHRRGPFVAANCAVLPEALVDSELFGCVKGAFTGADRDRPGLFEQAHGGTLFLDEIACLSAGAQESLLRVLETGEVRRLGATKSEKVSVRVVAATNEDLELAEGFRRDLFYRLNVLKVEVPPLRDRLADLPELADRFLRQIAEETRRPPKRLGAGALDRLAGHRWPGNVREFLNALRRAASLAEGGTLEASDFSFLAERTAPGPEDIVSIDQHIRATLAKWSATHDLQEIADRLGLSRKTLWEKKKKWGL